MRHLWSKAIKSSNWRLFIAGVILAIVIIVVALVIGHPTASTQNRSVEVGGGDSDASADLDIGISSLSLPAHYYTPDENSRTGNSSDNVPPSPPVQAPPTTLPINMDPGQPVVGHSCMMPGSGGMKPMCMVGPSVQ